MKVNQNLLPASKYNLKAPYSMNAEFIVVHNTANDATAQNEISYMIRNNYEVSFHVAVDDKEIWQGVPFNRNTWNAGDGANGKGNRKGISIEICYSKSGGTRFDNAEKLASKYIASLLKERGWGIEKVFKHQDFNGKYCPHRTLDKGWQRFLNMIKKELDALNPQEEKEAAKTETRTDVQLACAVWADEFGSGEARKKALGKRYDSVQALVNKGVGKIKKSSVTCNALADEVMKGLWGNGSERRNRLESNGFDYDAVQQIINHKYY